MQRQLRKAYLAYDADGDIAKLVEEVDELRRKFESVEASAEEPEARAALTARDLHLVCFEYVG